MKLPDDIARACEPLFARIPPEESMPSLLGSHPRETALVEEILANPALAGRGELAAGLWLYVDNLERSHTVSQSLTDQTGAFWHGIMHRREGDFDNSRYWMRRAQGHPLLQERPDLNPARLVEDVEADAGRNSPALVARQREEWQALFSWCARGTGA